MNILDSTFDFEERFVAFIDILGFKEHIFNRSHLDFLVL